MEYLTNDLLDLQKDQDYFVKKADWTGDPCDKFIAKCMISVARAAVDKARAKYHKTLLKTHGRNSKRFWDKIEDVEPEQIPEWHRRRDHWRKDTT